MNRQDDPQLASIWARFDNLFDRFEQVWASGVAPEIRRFLPEESADFPSGRRMVLVELIKIDLERRWRSEGAQEDLDSQDSSPLSAKPTLEDYVSRYPELGPLDSLPLDLISHEYDVRTRFGDQPSLDEYGRRFPRQAEEFLTTFGEAANDTSISPTITQFGSTPATTSASVSLKRFGDYELIEEIARGGMGVVFKARQVKLNRIVAMKMILSGDLAGEEEVWRFKAEAEAAANLDHPGIVPIYEIGEYNGQHFFSMGFVEGKSLAARVKEEPLLPGEAALIVKKVAEAVAYAHEKGVIHRDLKPANVLLDAKGEPRVTDFGLAKQVQSDRDLTRTGAVMGTPNYMPPEQAAGRTQDVDVQSDVYSLGAILYEMLVGRPPFRGATPLETLRQVLEVEPVDPSRLNPAVNRDLETICLKCLAKERERRYPTAAALAEELDRYLDGRPIQARRLGSIARAYRWCRRRPMQAGFVATVIFFAIALGTFFVMNRRADHALQVSKLKSNFTAQLSDVEPTPASIAGLESLVDTLRYLSPADADAADQELTQEVANAIEVQLQRRLVTGEDAAMQEAMDWVRKRDADLGNRLEANWRARLSDWRELARLEPTMPASDVSSAFLKPEVDVADGAIVRLEPKSGRVFLKGDCPTTTELEVDFADGWREGTSVGLLLNADQDRGYEFVLLAPKGDDEEKTARKFSELSPADGIIVQIRKSGGVLQRQVIPAGQLASDHLTLRARRERNSLSFQVGALTPLQVQDVFASSSARGSFGVIWPSPARIASLQARYRDLPSEPRAIEQADQFLEQNQFAKGLEIYQQLARQSSSPADRAELNYKAALCLLKLRRTAEGIQLLEEVRQSGTSPWDLLASSQRWLMHLQNQELDEANAIYDQLAAAYSFEQLAAAIPSEQRDQILKAVFSQRPDADVTSGVVQLERKMALDRLLSIDGRGDNGHHEDCIKAIELIGAVALAEDLWIKHTREFPLSVTSYCRLASIERGRGNFGFSQSWAERGIAAGREPGDTLPPFTLQLEQIRTFAAEGNLSYSLVLIDQFIPTLRSSYAVGHHLRHEKIAFLIHLSHATLIRGFILDELGRSEEATQAWREGYLETRVAIGQVNATGNWLVPNVLILGALSGELKREDIPGLIVMLSGAALPQQLIRVGVGQIGEELVHKTLLGMWRHPHTRKIARDGYAWQLLSFRDRYRLLPSLAGQEFLRQTAFGGKVSDEQLRILEVGVDELIPLIESKQLSLLDLMTLMMNWKRPGESGAGFEPIVAKMTPRVNALACYVIGHRLSAQGASEQNVARWLDRAHAGLRDDKELAGQIQRELDELNSHSGRLTLVNPLNRPVKVRLQGPNDFDKTAELVGEMGWTLPTGQYQASVLEDSIARFENDKFLLRPLEPQRGTLQSRWSPGSEEGSWPGIVQRPAEIPGVKKWQLVSRLPKTSLSAIKASNDGLQIAIGGRDGTLRIYNAEEKTISHWLPGHALAMSAISWSDDGQELLTTSLDGSYQIWSLAESRLVSSGRQEYGYVAGALSPDGSLFATGSYDKTIQVRRRDGSLLRTYSKPETQAHSLCWTADGRQLVSADTTGQFCVWNLEADEPEFQKDFKASIGLSMTDDRTRVAVWKLGGGAIEILDTKNWNAIGSIATDIGGIRSVVWDDSGTNLAVLALYGEFRIYDANFAAPNGDAAAIGKVLKKAKSGETTGLTRLGANRWACIGYNGTTRLWDADLRPTDEDVTSGVMGVNFLQWRPSGDELTVGCNDGRMRFFDFQGVQRFQMNNGSTCFSAAWSGDGEQLAICQWNGETLLFDDDLVTSRKLPSDSSRAYLVWTAAQDLVSATEMGEFRLHDIGTGESRKIVDLKQRVVSPLIALRDSILFPTLQYEFAKLELEEPFSIHFCEYGGVARGIATDPTSDWVAVTWGNTIRIYASDEFEQPKLTPLRVWSAGIGQMRNVVWSSDGKHLYAMKDDGDMQQWNRSGELTAKLKTTNQLIPNLLAISHDEKIAVTGTDVPFITYINLETTQTMFSLLLREGGEVMKIYPGGYCDGSPEVLDDSFVCVILNDDGTVTIKSPSEFLNVP